MNRSKAPRVCIRILPDSPIHLIHLIHFGLKMRMAAVLATFRVNQGVNQSGQSESGESVQGAKGVYQDTS